MAASVASAPRAIEDVSIVTRIFSRPFACDFAQSSFAWLMISLECAVHSPPAFTSRASRMAEATVRLPTTLPLTHTCGASLQVPLHWPRCRP